MQCVLPTLYLFMKQKVWVVQTGDKEIEVLSVGGSVLGLFLCAFSSSEIPVALIISATSAMDEIVMTPPLVLRMERVPPNKSQSPAHSLPLPPPLSATETLEPWLTHSSSQFPNPMSSFSSVTCHLPMPVFSLWAALSAWFCLHRSLVLAGPSTCNALPYTSAKVITALRTFLPCSSARWKITVILAQCNGGFPQLAQLQCHTYCGVTWLISVSLSTS